MAPDWDFTTIECVVWADVYSGIDTPVLDFKCWNPAVHICAHRFALVWPYPLLHSHGHALDVAVPVYALLSGLFVHAGHATPDV